MLRNQFLQVYEEFTFFVERGVDENGNRTRITFLLDERNVPVLDAPHILDDTSCSAVAQTFCQGMRFGVSIGEDSITNALKDPLL